MKRSPLRKVSKRRAEKNKIYSHLRHRYLAIKFECQVGGCNNYSKEIHHMKGRCGDLLCDDRYFLAVCRRCHRKIETNRKWAMEMGYSLDRLAHK